MQALRLGRPESTKPELLQYSLDEMIKQQCGPRPPTSLATLPALATGADSLKLHLTRLLQVALDKTLASCAFQY